MGEKEVQESDMSGNTLVILTALIIFFALVIIVLVKFV